MPAVAALLPGAHAAQTLRRTLPPKGPWRLVRCRGIEQLERTLRGQLVDAVVFSPGGHPGDVSALRARFPHIPCIVFTPLRADHRMAIS